MRPTKTVERKKEKEKKGGGRKGKKKQNRKSRNIASKKRRKGEKAKAKCTGSQLARIERESNTMFPPGGQG